MRWSILAALLVGCAMPSWAAAEHDDVVPRAEEPERRETPSAPVPTGSCAPPLEQLPRPPVDVRTTPAGPEWTRVASLNRARFGAFAHVLSDGRVLVVGGTGEAGTEGVELYDPGADRWSFESEWPASERAAATGMVDAGRVVAITHATSTIESRTRIYDVERKSWFVGAPPPLRYTGTASMTRLRTGELLIVGGVGLGITTSAARYDPVRNVWRTAAHMSTGRAAHRAMLLEDGRVLVVGGYSKIDRPIAEIYDPERDAWTPVTAPRPEPDAYVWDLGSAWQDHGRIMVPGRSNWTSFAAQPIAILDVECDRFSDVLFLPVALESYQPLALENSGTALIGGAPRVSWSDMDRASPLIDARTKTVRLLQALPERRDRASSVVLQTGEILAFGGTLGSCDEVCWGPSYADAWKLRP